MASSGGAGSGVNVQASFFGTDNVLQQMNVIGRAGEKFGSELAGKLGKMFGAVAIGTMAFQKLEQSIGKNMATAKQVSSLAIKFNVDPSAVHSMKIAADDAGVSIRSLMMASKQFGKVAGESLSSKAAAENMKQLGIESEKLAQIQSKPMKFLPEAAVALASIADENERAAAGAFLFGRQYQQIAPLLEKLGHDEQARVDFLSNANAMTNEQIALNKEAARIQSQMSDSWDKFVAAGTPALNWVMNFANYMMNALMAQEKMIANQDKLKGAKDKQNAGKVAYNLSSEYDAMKLRSERYKKAKESGDVSGLSPEDLTEMEEMDKAGGVDNYFKNQYAQLSTAGLAGKTGKKVAEWVTDKMDYVPGTALMNRIGLKGLVDYGKETVVDAARNTSEFLTPGGSSEGLSPRLKATVDSGAAASVSDAQWKEMDRAVQLATLASGGGSGEISKLGKRYLTEGQDEEAAALGEAKAYAVNAKRSASRLAGYEYDPETDRNYTPEEYARLMQARNADKMSGKVGGFQEAKARRAAEKKEKAQGRALAKSERHLNDENLSPVQKAEEAVKDIQEDMAPIEEDIAEKTEDEADAASRIKTNKEQLIALEEKRQKLEAEGAAALADMRKKAKDAGLGELTEDEVKRTTNAYKLTADELEKIGQLNGQIKGDEKILKQTQGEKVELQTKLNGEKAKEKAAIEALKKAKEADWAKEKKAAKDIADDKKAYEREMQGLKYKNMKLEGASQLDIMKERYNDELAHYTEAAQERESLEEEIAAKQAKRVEEAMQAGEANPYEAGKATDEETAQLKAAREKQDSGRKGLEDALYAMDSIKPKAVVSELGKMGGGAAVQFGNNPVDEIRKSNSFLKAIEKNTSSKNIKEVQKFKSKADKVYDEMDSGLFGDEVPM